MKEITFTIQRVSVLVGNRTDKILLYTTKTSPIKLGLVDHPLVLELTAPHQQGQMYVVEQLGLPLEDVEVVRY